MRKPLSITSTELSALAAFAATQSKVRTYHLERDTANVLYVHNPNGTLQRISPITRRPQDASTCPHPSVSQQRKSDGRTVCADCGATLFSDSDEELIADAFTPPDPFSRKVPRKQQKWPAGWGGA